MKKITFMLIALLCAMVTFAAGPKRSVRGSQDLLRHATVFNAQQRTLPVKGIDRKAQQPNQKALKRAAAELVTLPDGATPETYYTADGSFYINGQNGFTEATGDMASVQVAVVGTDIYVQGLAYWFAEGWIKGSLDGTTATFANGQLIGTDEYGDEFIVGSEDGKTTCDIVFTFDSAEGVLTAVTPYIIESASAEEVRAYCFWYNPVFTKDEPVGPQVVEVPEGLIAEEYSVTARDYKDEKDVKVSVNIAFDGNDVYVQGLCTWLPEAWVKGILENNTITFASGQYFGNYSINSMTYDMFLNVLLGEDVVFDYDAESGTLTAQNQVFLVDNSEYYFDSYRGCVLNKVIEKAAMPANPMITSLQEDADYGWYFTFNVPTVDVNGDGLVTSKLAYMIYTDVEGEIAPLTFTPSTHERLTDDLTEIPYGFTEKWDFYADQIYLNGLYSADWNKLGIQSIYYGGGETNATEIQWYDIKDNGGSSEGGTVWVASEAGYGNGDEVTEIKFDDYTTGLLDKAEGTNSPKYYDGGTALRMYAGNTMTISSEKKIEKIVFTFDTSRTPAFEVNEGKYDNDSYTWSGEASKIVFTVPNVSGQQTRIQQIKITYVGGGDEPGPEDPEEAIDPEGLTYTFEDGTLEGWTSIDADGDGYGWNNSLESELPAHNGSEGAVFSQSYNNNVGPLTPDNYLVSPKVKLGSTFSFFAVAQDASYPEEHFGVFVSTKSKSVADFEKVEEWTLSASRMKAPSKVQGRWYQYIVDLSKYQGEEGYVAIRHFDCTDNFYMLVDDITFGTPADPDPEPIQAPEGLKTEAYYFTALASIESEDEEGVYETESYANEVKVGFDGDDVYIQGLSEDYYEGWVKATKNQAGQYVIPANQYMGTLEIVYGQYSYQFPYYLTAVDDNLEFADVVLDFDAETNTFSTEQTLMLNGSRSTVYPYISFEEVTISKIVEMAGEPVNASITGYKLEDTSYPYVKFNIPTVDVDGNPMLTDKLFYTVWVEKAGNRSQPERYTVKAEAYKYVEEDMVEIPYNYDDSYDIYKGGETFYFNPVEEVADFTNIGIQTIYYGGDECNKTQIIWMDGTTTEDITTGIKDINTANNTAVYYDLQGRKVNAPQKGLFIKQTRQDNGAVKTVKMVRK